MFKLNRLNNLLIYMLLIRKLWPDNSKVLKVKILPMVKVIYNGGNLRCHMAKIPHRGEKTLTNRDGLLPMGPLIDLPCLLIPNFLSWLHLSF